MEYQFNKPRWNHKYQCKICLETFAQYKIGYDPEMDRMDEKCPVCGAFDMIRKFDYKKYKARRDKYNKKKASSKAVLKKYTPTDWNKILEDEYNKDYFSTLMARLESEYQQHEIFPQYHDIFNSINTTSYESTKVVILGQDPYINLGQAHGLAFSVTPSARIPPSLMNIFIELSNDLGCNIPDNGYLQPWARQGVLLLNTVLTVREGQSGSHRGIGWEQFTDRIIQEINKKDAPVVFMLWGKDAQSKAGLLDNPKHLVLTAPHPSPMNHGAFFGYKHFSKTNKFLRENDIGEINWQIPNLFKE